MKWRDICSDPALRELPHRVESDQWGNAVVGPLPTAWHSYLQGEIMRLLFELLPEGDALVAYPLRTSDGVKGIDVTWISREKRTQLPTREDVFLLAPEVCVEVMVPKNVRAEFLRKNLLYFERGAQESWICGHDGKLSCFDTVGRLAHSKICPNFPSKIELD